MVEPYQKYIKIGLFFGLVLTLGLWLGTPTTPTFAQVTEPQCACPGGCCTRENPVIPPLPANPACTPDSLYESCATPYNPQIPNSCYFPLNNADGTTFQDCPWRTEPNDCNPYIWLPTVYRPLTPSTVCPRDNQPNQSCTYPVPSQNYIKTPMESCNQPQVRQICSRSSGKMSTSACNGTSMISYIRKLNQCCDPAANVWVAGGNQAICSETEKPDSRCSACNGWEGVMCVDGTTDVCRKAIQVETFETRTRSENVPVGATCAACVQRKTVGQKMACDGSTCDAGCYCGNTCEFDGGGNLCDTSKTYSCGDDCCCDETHIDGCIHYDCSFISSPTNFPFIPDGCTESEYPSPSCSAGQCLSDSSCCRIQNQKGVNICSNPPGGCINPDTGQPACPGGCLVGYDNSTTPATALCNAPVVTSCGLCCGGQDYCGEDVSTERYFPPESVNCSLYEYTTRQNLYTVKYESNLISLTYHFANLSNHRIYDVRATMAIPDFLDIRNIKYNPGYGSYSVFCNGSRIDQDDWWSEYKNRECHGGSINLHFNNFQTRNYYLSNPPECMVGGVNRCMYIDENGQSVPIHVFTYPGDKLPDGTILISEFDVTITLIPSDIDSAGNSYYEDHPLGSLAEVQHYTNNLISDDRLANLEMKVFWPASDPVTGEEGGGTSASRVIEPLAFWIGKGVKSTAGPTCSDSACFIDPDSRPFGWPTFGTIAEDWGGADDIASASNIQWTNPLAADTAWDSANNTPRITLPDGVQNGEYISFCGDKDGGRGWRHAGITIIPKEGEASPPYVYSTQAGYVTHVGYNPRYPGRGYYVEIASSIDDDCQYNYVSRYGNLMEMHDEQGKDISSRVQVGNYVPRHKILGVMGDTGDTYQLRLNPLARFQHTGITRTLYQIRYNGMQEDKDDNNIYNPGAGTDDQTVQVDPVPIGNILYSPYFTEPDDVCRNSGSCGGDNCWNNPYICEYSSWQNYGPCDLAGGNSVFFCQNRRSPENVSRCYYANP